MPGRHDAPGGNYRGKRQADAKESPGASGRLEVVAAAGVLVRHIALARKGTSLRLRTCFCPHNPPRVVQGQRKARRITGRTTYLHSGALGWGWGGREFVLEGGGDYRRPAHGGNMDYLRGWIEDIPNRDRIGKVRQFEFKKGRPVVKPECLAQG